MSLQSRTRLHFNQATRLDRYFEIREQSDGNYGAGWALQLMLLEKVIGESKPCRRCGGRRRNVGTEPDGKPIWSEIGGCGWVDKRGRVPPKRRSDNDRKADALLGYPAPPMGEQLCPQCKGRGWVPVNTKRRRRREVTAWPTGNSVDPRGAGSGEAQLADPSGEITGWLCQLVEWERDADEPPRIPSLTIVEVYFASKRSRLHLWPLTHAGARLLRQAPENSDLHPIQWLDNERTAAHEQENYRNRMLVERAELEATRLLEQAVEAWNTLVPTEDQHRQRRAERECGLANESGVFELGAVG